MKKQYKDPTIDLTYVNPADILATSGELVWDGNVAGYDRDDTAEDIF